MNPLKQLAGQTALYGLSSIIGRLLNYFLVPLYTYTLSTSEYGVVTEMYAYSAFFLVILTYGMETAFFRYSELLKNREKVYGTTLISILVSSLIFVLAAFFFSSDVASLIHYPTHPEYIIWFAIILSADAITSIPFALLRAQNKAKRFVVLKLLNIGIYIGLNLFFILLCPFLIKHNILKNLVLLVSDGTVNVKYIFISNLIASAITLVLLLPEFVKYRIRFDSALWRKMILYALPLLIFGLAGAMNETLDRILLKYLLPADIAMSQVGIYGACYKISILMTIFIQAFRYAAEPFFFAKASDKNAPALYAQVMNYFIITVSLIFLGTMLYIDIVINFIGKDFREGAMVIPILLLANLFLGVYYNLSIWYKLTNKTIYGAFLSIVGALITVVLNFYWIPRIGYIGSAWATFICYGSMMILSFLIGQHYYPIPYKLNKILLYLGSAVLLYFISVYHGIELLWLRLVVNSLLLGVFLLMVYFLEFHNRLLKVERP